MKRTFLALLAVIVLAALVLAGTPRQTLAAPPDPTPEAPAAIPGFDVQGASPALVQSIQMALARAGEQSPLFQMYQMGIDHVETSDDGATALIFLAPLDAETGQPLGTEPVLAIAQLDTQSKDLANPWQITLQSGAGWVDQLMALPEGLLDPSLREDYIAAETNPGEKSSSLSTGTTYGGFLLPWAGGLTKRLTWGAYHPSCPSTCTYAFDFADGTMFPMLAAKGGTIYQWYDSCPNGSTGCTNSLTIKDSSTNPPTYQLYLHLREGSIPSKLKAAGTPVMQGEYIGDVDDTGYSSGHHLHFMVVTNPVLSSQGYMWGTSVDITFRDVPINWDSATQGGRPCTQYDIGYGKCTEGQFTYTSQNTGSNPPTGDLTAPTGFPVVTGPTVPVAGYGTDNLAVTRLQMLANYDGTWREVGPAQTATPFSYNLDLCSSKIPDGPVTLGLRVWDYEGNQTVTPLGMRSFTKDYPCSPPPQACAPSSNQVSLFSEPNYTGACQVFNAGEYDYQHLGSVGNDNAASVMVGSGVQAVLYDGVEFHQRTETLLQSDPNLSDNRLIKDRVSSIKVQARSAIPLAPVIENPWAQGLVTTTNDSIMLAWDVNIAEHGTGGGSAEYQAKLTGPISKTLSWTPAVAWSVGTLPAGTYTLQVWGRNQTTQVSPVSSLSFSVSAASLSSEPAVFIPYVDQSAGAAAADPASTIFLANFESGPSGWTASRSWRQATVEKGGGTTSAWVSNVNNSLGIGLASESDLTSPAIPIPAGGAWLRFDYRTQTEDANPYWDQRRLQISVDNGPFTDLLQFSGEVMNTWLSSPAIPLTGATYAGHSVRVRFHFNPIDLWSNGGASGWTVDNVSVTTTAPSACSDPSEPVSFSNETAAQAAPIAFGETKTGQICPNGDVDMYKFTGSAGQRVGVDLDAASLSPASALDSVVTLYSADGRSVLVENDDEVAQVRNDSALSFVLPQAGTYYIGVRAWNHPASGGANYNYQLRLVQDGTRPETPVPSVKTNGFLSGSTTQFTASVSDGESGIGHVTFSWHGPDWTNGTWTLLGDDWDPSDGWNAAYNPSSLPEGRPGYALLVRAYDRAGNVRSSVSWNLGIDRTAPILSLEAAPSSTTDTAIPVRWTASDNLAGLDHFVLEWSENGGGWQTYPGNISGAARQTWVVGDFGSTYSFRLRAFDRAGNSTLSQASQAVTVGAPCAGDAYEAGDNDPANATLVTVDTGNPAHTFCGKGDVDWYQVSVTAGKRYLFAAAPVDGSAAGAKIQVFATDPNGTAAASGSAATLGAPASVVWIPDFSGKVYIRIESIHAGVAGDGVQYHFSVGDEVMFLPSIFR